MTNLIQASELQKLINQPNVIILDCRSDLTDRANAKQKYLAGHIPGAIHAHLENDLSSEVIIGKTGRHPLPSENQWQDTLRSWGVTSSSTIIVYDQNNSMFAVRAWWLLKWAQLNSVFVLDGGLDAWLSKGGSSTLEEPTPTSSALTISLKENWTVDATELNQAFNTSKILDARALERYKGEVEPLDSKAGHIPTAQNANFIRNLNQNNCFLDKVKLAKRFSSLIGENVICYCGSGVTACHNILAIVEAGLPMPRLYPGSWSEWITNPNREIKSGIEGDVL